MDSQKVKETIKKHIDILLEDFVEDIDLIQILPSVAVQVVKDVNDYLEEKKKDPLSSSMVEELTKQINPSRGSETCYRRELLTSASKSSLGQ